MGIARKLQAVIP